MLGSVAESCLVFCDPVDCSPPGSSVHGILQARILEGVAISSANGGGCHVLGQRIFLIQALSPCLLHLLLCQAASLPLSHLGSPWLGEGSVYLLPHPSAYIPLPTKILHFLFFFYLNSKKCTSFLFLFSDLPRAPAVQMSAFISQSFQSQVQNVFSQAGHATWLVGSQFLK